ECFARYWLLVPIREIVSERRERPPVGSVVRGTDEHACRRGETLRVDHHRNRDDAVARVIDDAPRKVLILIGAIVRVPWLRVDVRAVAAVVAEPARIGVKGPVRWRDNLEDLFARGALGIDCRGWAVDLAARRCEPHSQHVEIYVELRAPDRPHYLE